MPTYEYYCVACDKDLEVFQSIKAEPLKVCPECDKKGKIKRKISGGSGILFKGSGFYETDYKKSGQNRSESSSSSDSGNKAASESSSKSSDKKSDSKS